jgi:Zinc carboxypeptidase
MQQINHALLALCACLLSTTATAQAQGTDRYHVPKAARETLVRMKSTVHHGSAGGYYTADLSPAEVETLRQAGFEVVPAPAEPPEEGGEEGALPSWTPYGRMHKDFKDYAAAYPAIAEFHVTGQSVQGRDIFALRISDNVAVEEDEPEVVFWANIHGDEQASGEIAYRWAMELLDGYGIDPALTGYVDDLEIWVIPLLNPDGHENNTRENFNGVDLNRDFGWNWDGWAGSTDAYSQPETRSLQDFCLEESISLSATLHCSGNIFLYPWCYSPHNVPEHDLVVTVGALYATAASYALIESWDDYETHGELLDLIHGGYGSLCYTPEISNSLPLFGDSYARNTAGMELFCNEAATGTRLHGLVTDAQTGQPLRATVTISGSPFPAYTDPVLGDVHRLVVPGNYDVTVWANGYVPQTVSGLQVMQGTATDFQVALQPGGSQHAFFVTSINQHDPNNAYTNVSPASDALGAPDGLPCSLGTDGFIVVDMGPGNEIVDGPGADFTVTEALVADDLELEEYVVFAGDAYDQDALIGPAQGTASFDLAGSGVVSTRWLRIVSLSQQPVDARYAGLDLDGVTILHGDTGAFVDIGPGTAGAFGTPSLTGSGDLTPGGAGFTLQISDVAPGAFGLLFVGLDEAAVPFSVKGVAFYLDTPWLGEIPLVVDAAGSASLPGTVSAALAGLDIALQGLWADATGPAGVATGTNGLRLEIP